MRCEITEFALLPVGSPRAVRVRAEVIHDVAMACKALDAGLEPLAEGSRTTIVRIEPTFLSGRRIVHDPPPSAKPEPVPGEPV